MRALAVAVLIAALAALLPQSTGRAQSAPSAAFCGSNGSHQMRTTLYFGLSHPAGVISESQWQTFLRQQVTPRFPDGLAVWQADGQWRTSEGKIAREPARVLLLVHDETPSVRQSITEIVRLYKRDFHQESVLWETAPVCAAF